MMYALLLEMYHLQRYLFSDAHLYSLLSLQTCKTHTWKQWVLYAEHGWPVSVSHDLHDLLFGYVCASIFDTNPSFQVVEMAPVQLKELDQQHAQIFIGVSGINTRMELKNKHRKTLLEYLKQLLLSISKGYHRCECVR